MIKEVKYSNNHTFQDEIDRASHADIFTIVLSYILMFVYVGVTLGDMDCSVKGCLLNSKVGVVCYQCADLQISLSRFQVNKCGTWVCVIVRFFRDRWGFFA